MTSCLFCRIISGEIPAYRIYETEAVLAFLDIHPVSRGHFLLIPKAHAGALLEGSREDACALMDAAHEMLPGILSRLGAGGFNISMNHGACAGQEVAHTHLHVIPRYEGQERTFAKHTTDAHELERLHELLQS